MNHLEIIILTCLVVVMLPLASTAILILAIKRIEPEPYGEEKEDDRKAKSRLRQSIQ